MANDRKISAPRKAPSHGQMKEARSSQYNKDYKFYKLFAQIWGWDGFRADPEKAVKKLSKYIKWEERKNSVKRQRPRDPELQFAVGVAYLSGWIPDEQYENKAAMWFTRSYQQGCDKGALGLGYMREHGLAGSNSVTDYEHMVEEYTYAAKLGNIYAQYRLANILFEVDPDNPRLVQLLLNAADAGYQPAKELFDRVCSRRKKAAAWEKQQLAALAQNQELNFDEIKEMLVKLIITSEDTLAIVKRVEAFLQMLQSSLNGMWKELRESDAETAAKLDEWKQMVDSDLQRAAGIEFASATQKAMKDAEEFMEVLFKGDWRESPRLCKESCDALVTARVLMEVAKDIGVKNYSGIVITAVWALEHECRRRFYDAYDSYLDKNRIKKPNCMYLNGDPSNKAAFSLGSLLHIVKTEEFHDFAMDHLLSDVALGIYRDEKYDSAKKVFLNYKLPGGKKFADMIVKLNDKYRVPAAHAHVLTQTDAMGCCRILGITDAQKEMDRIEGLLKSLLWLTKPLE